MWCGVGIKIVNFWRSLVSGPFGGHATLTDNLVSVWPISEDGFDVHGTNDLTNNNTVTFVAKGAGAPANMPANVANFVAASSQNFTGTAVAAMTNNFTWAQWINVGNATRWGLVNNGINAAPYGFTVEVSVFGAGDILVFAKSDGSDYAYTATGVVTTDGSAWRLLIIAYDTTEPVAANKIRVYVNDVNKVVTPAVAAVAHTVGNFLGIGRRTTDRYYQGKMSSPMIWSRILTAAERTDLYASGDGLFY